MILEPLLDLPGIRPQKFETWYATSLDRSRTFHIRRDLYEVLRPHEGATFEPADLLRALAPFDDLALILGDVPVQLAGSPQTGRLMTFQPTAILVRREQGDGWVRFLITERSRAVRWAIGEPASDVPCLVVASITLDAESGEVLEARGQFPREMPKRLVLDRKVGGTRDEDAVFSLCIAYIRLCDMLELAGKIIDVRRRIRPGKHKRVPFTLDLLRRQMERLPRGHYEIVLRPERTVWDLETLVTRAYQMRERQRPRRHRVREHDRTINGRTVRVREFVRGGASGPGAHYNVNPLARWVAVRTDEKP